MLSLGARMKQYEELNVSYVNPTQYYIIRLDGRSFSHFTRLLTRPFDERFTKVMISTMNALLLEFNPATVYNHSDEITLIFDRAQPAVANTSADIVREHLFGGRIFKILTILASKTSVLFNKFAQEMGLPTDELPVFDARIIVFDENLRHEILNHMIWRSNYDCQRNCISTYARHFYSHKEISGLNQASMCQLLADKGITIPTHLRYGVYGKKIQVEKIPTANDTGVVCLRREAQNYIIPINSYSDTLLNFMLDKYATDGQFSKTIYVN